MTASGHLITAIIGAGVLGLPHTFSWLGWIVGPVCLLVFFALTLWTATMLTDCYHVKGKRHTNYKWAVLHIMGPAHSVVLAVCQNLNMVRMRARACCLDCMHVKCVLRCGRHNTRRGPAAARRGPAAPQHAPAPYRPQTPLSIPLLHHPNRHPPPPPTPIYT